LIRPIPIDDRFSPQGSEAFLEVLRAQKVLFLFYELVEVAGAKNHDCPNRKVDRECKDDFHIIAPWMIALPTEISCLFDQPRPRAREDGSSNPSAARYHIATSRQRGNMPQQRSGALQSRII
jgi:hypothetical protein